MSLVNVLLNGQIQGPSVRWYPAGPYDSSGREFLRQNPAHLSGSASLLSELREIGLQVQAALQDADLFSWHGGAADTYRAFVNSFRQVLITLDTQLTSAIAALEMAAASVTSQLPVALEATAICNDAQNIAKAANQETGFPALFDDARAKMTMQAGMDRGTYSLGGVRWALADLGDALAPIDEAISALKIVKPTALSGPDASIFAPIDQAEAKDGDTSAAEAALARLTDKGGVFDLQGELAGLSPVEMQWVIDHLPSDRLRQILGRLDPVKDKAEYEWLAQHLPQDSLRLLGDVDPNYVWQPPFSSNDTSDIYWGTEGSANPPTADLSQLHQGGLGDCTILASLGAIEKAQPGYLNRHIQTNANGTYTVTLYHKDGSAFTETVTSDMPRNGLDSNAYAQDSGGNVNAYQIYEKAIAQASVTGDVDLNDKSGGYSDESGGNAANVLPVVTGQKAIDVPSNQVQATQLQAAVNSGQPVAVGTVGDDSTGGKSRYDTSHPPYLIPGHAYYVQSVDLSAHPPTVTLVNPWGQSNATADHPDQNGTVTLTIDQLNQQTSSVQFGGAS